MLLFVMFVMFVKYIMNCFLTFHKLLLTCFAVVEHYASLNQAHLIVPIIVHGKVSFRIQTMSIPTNILVLLVASEF